MCQGCGKYYTKEFQAGWDAASEFDAEAAILADTVSESGESMNKYGVVVSDHALIRYMERVLHMDVEEYRNNLCKYIGNIVFLKRGCKLRLGTSGKTAIIRGKIVATII